MALAAKAPARSARARASAIFRTTKPAESIEVARATGREACMLSSSDDPSLCSRARTRGPVTLRNRTVGSVFSRIVNVASASSPFFPLAAKPTSSN
jgi:hypothetical protein